MPTPTGGRSRSRKPLRSSKASARKSKPATTIRSSPKRVKSPRAGTRLVSRQRHQLVTRPSSWWREPLTPARLRDLRESGASQDEINFIRTQERQLKVELLKNQIRDLRQFSVDFDASVLKRVGRKVKRVTNYPLDENKLIRLHPSKLRKLKDAHEQLVRAKGQPYVLARPRTAAQYRSVGKRAGVIIPGQKVFFVHGVSTQNTEARFSGGVLEIVSKATGGEVYDRHYYFPRRPRSWNEVKKFTRQLQKTGMRTGNYKLLNSLYGPIGGLVDRDQLLEQLDEYFGTYNRWMAGTILGWRWYGTSIDRARDKQRREKTAAQRFKETRDFLAKKAKRKIEEKLGKAKRCKKCRRVKCVCKAPEF